MPQYLALIYVPVDQSMNLQPDTQAKMNADYADYAEFGDEAGAAGVLDGGNALYPVTTATTISVLGGKGGDVVTTDGPFAETKEVLGGYYLLNCADLDEAVSWAAKIPGAWNGGKVEVRPIVDFS